MQIFSKERNNKRIVIINTGLEGSTGKIVRQLKKVAEESGHMVWTASSYQRKSVRSDVERDANNIVIGDFLSLYTHLFLGHLTGMSGVFSYAATLRFLKKLDAIEPDVVHLHNLHDSYINLPLLFNYIKKKNIRCIWTFHDCWPMTGRCPYFDLVNCTRWKTGCGNCKYSQKSYPPASLDSTKMMWKLKKSWFTGIDDFLIVTPSKWLADIVRESYFSECEVKVIHNGIDLQIFKPTKSDFRKKYGLCDKHVILGVAFGWERRKGLDVFIKLAKRLTEEYRIILVGTDEVVDSKLPTNIISIHRTQNQMELAEIYSAADVLVNPTREDNFPTVNIESIACGTPVITFNTGGSPEALNYLTGRVVEVDDIDSLVKDVVTICEKSSLIESDCIAQAEKFDMKKKFKEYIELYNN